MDRMSRAGAGSKVKGTVAVLLLVVIGVVATACSSGVTSSPVASLPGHGAVGTTAPTTQSSSDQALVRFARCMRTHGVSMSDPSHRPGHSGLSIQLPPQDSSTQAAYAACNHYIAQLVQSKQAKAGASLSQNLPALINYARCMRDHNIPMLDPSPQGGGLNLGNVPGINNPVGRYSAEFRAADTSCRHFLPAGVRDDGSGP